MAVISGKNGKITLGASDLAEVRNWRFSMNANIKKYASSSTAGHEKSVKGMFGGTVSAELVYDPADPLEDRLKVGDTATLLCKDNATRTWTIPVRISTMDHEVQVEEGEPLTMSIEAECNGAWTYPDGVASAG